VSRVFGICDTLLFGDRHIAAVATSHAAVTSSLSTDADAAEKTIKRDGTGADVSADDSSVGSAGGGGGGGGGEVSMAVQTVRCEPTDPPVVWYDELQRWPNCTPPPCAACAFHGGLYGYGCVLRDGGSGDFQCSNVVDATNSVDDGGVANNVGADGVAVKPPPVTNADPPSLPVGRASSSKAAAVGVTVVAIAPAPFRDVGATQHITTSASSSVSSIDRAKSLVAAANSLLSKGVSGAEMQRILNDSLSRGGRGGEYHHSVSVSADASDTGPHDSHITAASRASASDTVALQARHHTQQQEREQQQTQPQTQAQTQRGTILVSGSLFSVRLFHSLHARVARVLKT
jgi:hypothetical protein